MATKSNEADRIVELEHDVADLKRQLALVVAFLDVEVREQQELTSDQIRAIWRETPAFTRQKAASWK
jgi:hypothetical protein